MYTIEYSFSEFDNQILFVFFSFVPYVRTVNISDEDKKTYSFNVDICQRISPLRKLNNCYTKIITKQYLCLRKEVSVQSRVLWVTRVLVGISLWWCNAGVLQLAWIFPHHTFVSYMTLNIYLNVDNDCKRFKYVLK